MKEFKTIDGNGRIVLPKRMRKQLDLGNNDTVEIQCEENRIIICNPEHTNLKNQLIKAIEEGLDKETLLDLIERL